MSLNLDALVDLHPDLPDEIAAAVAFGAAVALERRHEPGVLLRLDVDDRIDHPLVWRRRGRAAAEMIDAKRATEDGAEAIALGLVGHHRPTWRLVRRLQSGRRERADWLFEIVASRDWIVLEISGTDAGDVVARAKEKRAQAASSTIAERAAACVVRFAEPRASLWESQADGSS